MKILLVKSYNKLTSVGVLGKELKKRGHQVHILVPRISPDQEEMSNLGIPLHIIDFAKGDLSRFNNPKKAKMCLAGLIKLVPFLHRHSFDIINPNLRNARLFLRLAHGADRKGFVVSTIRGMEHGYERLTNWIDRATVAVSPSVKNYLICNGIPSRKIEVISNGLDLDEIDKIEIDPYYLHKELEIDRNTKLIGMVAYFRKGPLKGHKVFVDAARMVLQNNAEARFVIVGSNMSETGHTRAYCEQYCEELNIRDKVYFLGERSDVLSLMGSFYAHVLPSFSEGCPMVVLEAMSRRVPNIASRIEGITHIISDNEDGVLFDPGDPRQLAKSIIQLLDNSAEATKIGCEGRKRLESNFTSKSMADRYESLFQRLLN
jgi:glycosyltransferase involved in cell wall biosynthesis